MHKRSTNASDAIGVATAMTAGFVGRAASTAQFGKGKILKLSCLLQALVKLQTTNKHNPLQNDY